MNEQMDDHPQVIVQPSILTFIFILAALGINWIIPFKTGSPTVKWVGVAIVLTGLAIALLAVRRFGLAGTTLSPHGSVSTLVMDGPYRFSRNPIYLGYVSALIGLPLALGTFWGLILSPLLVLSLDYFVIRSEEHYLGVKFGSGYAQFKSRVRRWL